MLLISTSSHMNFWTNIVNATSTGVAPSSHARTKYRS